MASLVAKQRVVELATSVLWCGGPPHETSANGRSAALLLDYVAAVRTLVACAHASFYGFDPSTLSIVHAVDQASDEVWSGELADLVVNQLPVHAGKSA